MTKPVVYSALFVLCLVLQVALSPVIAIGGCPPNFLLAFVVVVAAKSGYSVGSLAGFLCGLFEDFVGNGTIGCMALSFTVTALVVGAVCSLMQAQSPFVSCIVGVFASLLAELGYGIASIISAPDAGGGFSMLVSYALPCGLYSAVFVCLALVGAHVLLGFDVQGGLGGGTQFPKIDSRLK